MSEETDRALITRVLKRRNIQLLVKKKVTPDTMSEESTRDQLRWIYRRFDKFGKVPSTKLFCRHFPDFETEPSDDSLAQIVQTVLDERLYVDLQRGVKEIATEAKMDPREGLASLINIATRLAVRFSEGNGEDVMQEGDQVWRLYQRIKKLGGVLGIPWPWGKLTEVTGGIEKGSLSCFYGPAGSMKTWLLLVIALHAHSLGITPLFLTFEMTVEDIRTRCACLLAKVDYGLFRKGKLSRKQERRFRKKLRAFKRNPPFIVEELESQGDGALTEIQAKVKQYRAGLILIDGLAFVADDVEWQSWTKTIKGLRTMAKSGKKIPIVATHHSNSNSKKAKMKEGDADDVALGKTLERYCTNLVRIFRTPENAERDEIGMSTVKVREGIKAAWMIHAKPATDFSQSYDLDQEEGGGINGSGDESDDDGFSE